jgi:hypothetical protein
MKSRRLTETDLANMAFLPSTVKMKRIESLIGPKIIRGSYEPFRTRVGDAVNEQFPFLEEKHEATSLDTLEEVVCKACKGNVLLLEMNLTVAKATHTFAVERQLSAERFHIRPITLPFGHAYEFGMPLLVRYEGSASAVFPDLRRTNPLTESGRVVVTSWMHQRFRVNYPDLSSLKLEIWRYENNTLRNIRPIRASEDQLIGYDDLVADATESYRILHDLENGLTELRRRSGGGSPGPLFDR